MATIPADGGNYPDYAAGVVDDSVANGVTFAKLQAKHPDYAAEFWSSARALYAGGRKLFGDAKTFESLFPRHLGETDQVYRERKSRAFYINYPGSIIDHLVAGLMTCPVEVGIDADADEDDPPLPPFYVDFIDDVTPVGGRRCSLQQLVRDRVREALIVGCAWTQVDFPAGAAPDDELSAAAQEQAGLIDAYAIPLPVECVYDYEESADGALEWVNVAVDSCRRGSIRERRNLITRTWTLYTPTSWERYELTFDPRKPPKPATVVPLVAAGAHSFGAPPFARVILPDGLHAMGKMLELAREHFNKRCALSTAEYKSLFPELYEFEAPPDPMMIGPAIAEDEGRALKQVHGQGYVQLRYAHDRAEYVGPDSTPFGVALQSLKDLRDEMHRITHQMALTFDNSPSALGRSGDSKAQDRAAHAVVLVGLGELLRDFVRELMDMVAIGRGDEPRWAISGLDRFDVAEVADVVEQAERLEVIPIPSPTYQLRHRYHLAKTVLGDEASETDLAAIEVELRAALTAEQMMTEQMTERDAHLAAREAALDDDGAAMVDELDDDDEPTPPQRRGTTSRPRA